MPHHRPVGGGGGGGGGYVSAIAHSSVTGGVCRQDPSCVKKHTKTRQGGDTRECARAINEEEGEGEGEGNKNSENDNRDGPRNADKK